MIDNGKNTEPPLVVLLFYSLKSLANLLKFLLGARRSRGTGGFGAENEQKVEVPLCHETSRDR
jgi:hypothetical protein